MVRAPAPTININERIQTSQQFLNIKNAALLPANSGYGNLPYIIEDENDLIETFGYPTAYNYKYWFQIWNYLQYENDGIWVTRPVKTTDKNYSIQLTGTTITDNSVLNSNLYDSDLASNLVFNDTITNSLEVYNRYVENDSKLAVVVCSSEAYWQEPISNEEIEIIRNIDVYDYNTLSSELNNRYQITFDTYSITSSYLFDDTTNTDSYIVVPGNLTHIEVGESIRLDDGSAEILDVDEIEYNGYREEDIEVGFSFSFTSGSNSGSAPVKGDLISNPAGTINGYIHSVTLSGGTWVGTDAAGTIVIYGLDGEFVNGALEINTSGTGDDLTIVAIDFSASTPAAIIIVNGNHQYLEATDIVNFSTTSTNYTIASVEYFATEDTTNIVTDLTCSSYDTLTSASDIIIQSDTTFIITSASVTATPTFDLMYLAQDWNNVDYGLGGTYGTVLENAEDDDILIYNYNTNVWEIDSALSANAYYYIKDLDAVYQYLTGTLTLSTLTAFEYSSTIAIKDLYDSKLIRNNSIVTFEEIIDREPIWTDGEFAIAILRKNIDSDKFELVENYVLEYNRTSEIKVYNESNFVYLKVDETLAVDDADRVDTYNSSIEDLTITVDETKNYDNISYFTNSELYDVVKIYLDKDSYGIDFLLGFKSYIDGNFYSLDTMTKISSERQNSISINSIWEETDFFGLTSEQILAKLKSYYGFKNSYEMIKNWSEYSAFFANMKLQYDKYNDEYRWIPLNGDVAGLSVETAKISSGVGVGNNIKNCIRLLFNLSTYNHRKEMNLNGLNVVQYDNLKNPIIFDSVTLTKDLESPFREFHLRKNMDMIKNDLRNLYFSKLLKLVTDDSVNVKSMTNNYLATLVPNVLKSYNSKIKISGSAVYVTLSLTFTEILRTVEVEITIDDTNINIIEK